MYGNLKWQRKIIGFAMKFKINVLYLWVVVPCISCVDLKPLRPLQLVGIRCGVGKSLSLSFQIPIHFLISWIPPPLPPSLGRLCCNELPFSMVGWVIARGSVSFGVLEFFFFPRFFPYFLFLGLGLVLGLGLALGLGLRVFELVLSLTRSELIGQLRFICISGF